MAHAGSAVDRVTPVESEGAPHTGQEGATVTQCQGRTRKGEQCKREARPDSAFCSIHVDQEIRPPADEPTEWDQDAIWKAALGFAVVGAIFLFRCRR